MALLEREVWRPGARLYLEVLTSNAAARAFYEALGFSSYAVTLEKAGPEGRVGAFNFIQASERVATSGAVPPGGFERMAAAGYGSVINLLPDDNEHALPQEAERVAEHGMDYVHIPVDFGAPTDADFEAFVDAMRAREGDKIWVHCAANYRVSAFFSLYAQRQLGWSVERADALVARAWEPDAVWSAFIRRVRDP